MYIIIWALTRENLSSGVCEQQRHRPACASAQSDQRLCFRFLESIMSKLATCSFSTILLVYVAEQAGLNLALSETPKTGFIATRPISGKYGTVVFVNSACWVIFPHLLTFFKINFLKKLFCEYYQSVKQFGSRSGAMFCWA